MKKSLTLVIPLVICLGLPATFVAQAFFSSTPLEETPLSAFFLFLLIALAVLSIFCVIKHYLREDDQLNALARTKPTVTASRGKTQQLVELPV